MRIITYTCDACGTIVSANELESNRVMKCPGLDCDSVLRFDALPDDEQEFFVNNVDQYKL